MIKAIAAARSEIVTRQKEWAAANRLNYDERLYLPTLEDNVFQPLNAATRAELNAAAGGELGAPDRPGKLASLRSSSAMVVNLFDAWRPVFPSAFSEALGLSAGPFGIRFEGIFPTGLSGTPPHLDVVLEGRGPLVGIEAKFVEPYDGVRNEFKRSYFQNEHLWRGLPNTERLATGLASGAVTFLTLHAAQLIKHALGLRRANPDFTLVYLWYRHPTSAGEVADAEVRRFAELIGDDFRFRSLSVDDLLANLAQRRLNGTEWYPYVRERYGS